MIAGSASINDKQSSIWFLAGWILPFKKKSEPPNICLE